MGDIAGLEVLRFRISAGDKEGEIGRDPDPVEGQCDADQHRSEDQHRPPGRDRSGTLMAAIGG